MAEGGGGVCTVSQALGWLGACAWVRSRSRPFCCLCTQVSWPYTLPDLAPPPLSLPTPCVPGLLTDRRAYRAAPPSQPPEPSAEALEAIQAARCASQGRGSVYDSTAGITCHFCREWRGGE